MLLYISSNSTRIANVSPPAEFNPFVFAPRLSSSTRERNRFGPLERYIEFVNETEKHCSRCKEIMAGHDIAFVVKYCNYPNDKISSKLLKLATP